MKLFSRLFDHRFCAFCRAPRRMYLKKHIDLTNVLASGAMAGLLSVVVYGQLDPRALLLFSLLVVLGEAFVYLRWRAVLVCKLCGFDPLLYKKSPQAAAQRVRRFFEQQSQKPHFLLSKSPLLEVYRRQQRAERRRPLVPKTTPVVAPRGLMVDSSS